MSSPEGKLELAQVALICDRVDVHATRHWYERVVGFLPAGWTDKFGGPDLAELQDLSDQDCKLTIAWMVERNEAFQLELFEYTRPESAPRPADWTPRDIGYTMATLFVADFDGLVERARAESALRAEPIGPTGTRRAIVEDPNGILLEFLEQDIAVPGAEPRNRPEVGLGVRSIRASVPSLDKSLGFFVDGFGLTEVDVDLHTPEHEALWGLAGAEREVRVLAAGDLLLELVEYRNPAGRPRPDGYQLSDGGVMNIALATTSHAYQQEMLERIVSLGHESRDFQPNASVDVAYVTDDQGFNVELLFMAADAYPDFGFVPEAAGA